MAVEFKHPTPPRGADHRMGCYGLYGLMMAFLPSIGQMETWMNT